MEGAESELIVPSAHPAHQNPKAIAEVRRILMLNLGRSETGSRIQTQRPGIASRRRGRYFAEGALSRNNE
jgi:hypothetical protein